MEEPRVRPAVRAVPAACALLLVLLLPLPASAADGPLFVNGDLALAQFAHAGAGTAEDPYRIRDLVISAAQTHGIEVSNTRAHLVLEGIAVASGGAAWDGIRLVNVRNVTVQDSVLESNRVGIQVTDSQNVTILRTTAKTGRVGVALERSRDVLLADNRLSVNEKDVSLRESRDNRFVRNNLTIATGQHGFFFEDAASYRNDIGTSNVVNFLPVHWYVAPCPARVTGISMELKGATNVAQVMLHGCEGTLVEDVRAKDGVKAGIHLVGTANVTLRRLMVEGNAGPGIHLEKGADARLAEGALRANGVGLRVEQHPRASAEDLRIESNQAEGVRATQSPDLSLLRPVVRDNGGRGIALESSPKASVANATLANNRNTGMHLQDSPNTTLTGNALTDNAGAGIHLVRSQAWASDNALRGQPRQVQLSATAGGELLRNNLTLAHGQVGFHFDDAASYANVLGPTNLVNGVPLRWYHDVGGTPEAPLRLGDFNASVTGATNVAQVMIHQSRHVALDNVTASEGLAHGIFVAGSHNVTMTRATMQANARHGLLAQNAPDLRVEETTARGNREDGANLVDADRARLEALRTESNHGRGAFVEGSPLATLRGVVATANRGAGLHLARASFSGGTALLENNVVRDNGAGGILLHDLPVGLVRANLVADNGPEGIHLQGVPPGATLRENEVRNHTRNIHLAVTRGAQAYENVVLLRQDQHGFFLADETSYNNTLDVTNLVNGTPVRWYNEIVGTSEAPVVIDDARSELRGVTNVAQVFVRRAQNVTLSAPLAMNGTHRGLVVLDSANVTIMGARVENNSLDGVQARGVKDAFVYASRATGNRGHGVHLQQSDRVRIDSVTLADNGQQGMRAELSSLSLRRGTITGNGDLGLHASGDHPGGLSVQNGTFLRNRAGGIRLDGVRLHDLRDNQVENNTGPGTLVANGRFGEIHGNFWANNTLGGLRIEGATPGNVTGNVLRHNGEWGILLSFARPGGNVSANLLLNHTKGLAFAQTRGWHADHNEVEILRGQTAYHFGDEHSYDNLLPPTNLANGTALRWYAGLRGPIRLENLSVEVRGATNVGQIVLAGARNVVLAAPVAANGTGPGIFLHRSANVTIEGGRIENNSLEGVRVHHGGSHTVRDALLRGNGGAGVHLQESGGNLVEGATILESGGAGVVLRGRASGNEVAGSLLVGNRGGVDSEDAIAPRVVRNNLTDNGPFGVSLVRTSGIARVWRNEIANHSLGVRLAATEYADVSENRVTLGGTGFHFDDETSYNNQIYANTVNGTSVEWHVGLTGTESNPVRLRGVKVEQRGVTNVAQFMLYRSSYVVLDPLVASNGTAAGVLLYHSSSIVMRNVTATGNQDGVLLKSTQSSQLLGLDLRGNARGVKLVASGNNVVQGVDASGADVGVLVADAESRSNRVSGTIATGARTASVQDATIVGLRGNNLVADAGLDRRVRVEREARFEGGLASYRFETERIVHQRWEFGDNASAESADAVPFRPLHAYAEPGTYQANLTVRTADGQTLRDAVTVTVMPPLGPPLHLRPVVGSKNVTLFWNAPLSDGASPITGYRVYRGIVPDNLTFLAQTGPEMRHHDAKDLANGQAYHYAVSAVNADGEGPRSAQTTAMPGAVPSAPRDPAIRAGSGNVTLSWTPPQDEGGRPVIGYRVYRGPTPRDLSYFAEAGITTRWVDATVANGVHYHYAIAAVNAMGEGARSVAVSATPTPLPAVPGSLHALPGERVITLVWTQESRPGDAAILHYRVYRGEGPDNLTFLAQSAAREYRDLSVLQGIEYHYAVSAVNDAGEGPRSAVVNVTLQERDGLKPIVLARGPDAHRIHETPPPEVWMDYLDNLGVEVAGVRLEVDGVDATASANVTARSLRYAPPTPFGPGNHTVRVLLPDAAGNVADVAWTFRVLDLEALQPRWEHAELNLSSPHVRIGESILVQSLVRNVGGGAGTLEIHLLADGQPILSRNVTLEAGTEERVGFRYKPTLVGLVNLTVGNQTPLPLRVLAEGEDPSDPIDAGVARNPDGSPRAVPLPDEEEADEDEAPKAPEKKSFLPMPAIPALLAGAGLGALLLRRRA